ncbi:MAG: rSAM-modified peptide [Bacteroidales bacterium]|nr:rSAM-modified peptide [Bacteroidales bacterium]
MKRKSELVTFAKENISKRDLKRVKGGNAPKTCLDCSCTSTTNSGCINGPGTQVKN